jgi:single-stranded-DNA-specific exonuclease
MTMRNAFRWHDPPAQAATDCLVAEIGGLPLISDILMRRGYSTPEMAKGFLSPSHYSPTDASELPDLDDLINCLADSIIDSRNILIWGDFDVDGQTATALFLDALRQVGAQVEFYIPNRARESHGVQLTSLTNQLEQMQVDVLLTCDTGISAHEAIDLAHSLGITTLITDHHDLPPTLPEADAIVNPKRLPVLHPLVALPGVGVAYKVIEKLYTRLNRADELPRFLDLVALGIVADVAELVHDTRYLLQCGLQQLQQTERAGLQALIQVAGLDKAALSPADIGFQLAPRLNAAGRLDDARLAVDLLTTTDPTQAHLLSVHLEGLNNQRRLHNRQIYAAAQEQIARDPSLLDWEALVLASPTWHPGIIGIVANRLAEYYQRPVVLFNTADENVARGSARSIPGYDIGAAIAAQADLLIRSGGHPGAAGLSLHPDNIPAFRRRLSNTLRENHDPNVQQGLQIDAYISLDETTAALARELDRLAPFGAGNPAIVLATTELHLRSSANLGRSHEHRRLIVEDGNGTRRNVIWWNSGNQSLPEGKFDLAYELELNKKGDKEEIQLILVDYRRSASAGAVEDSPKHTIIDCRHRTNQEQLLQAILAQYHDVVVWAEGYQRKGSPGIPLSELHSAQVLVIYTPPTGPQALQEALERVQPATVVLLGIEPPIYSPAHVQRRLLELVNYVLHHQDGRTTLQALAEATAQPPNTVRLILEHLIAHGEITVEHKRGGSIAITRANNDPTADIQDILQALQSSFAETAAYRTFFHRATPSQLLGWTDT